MNQARNFHRTTLIAGATLALLLSACSRHEEQTAGQKLDETVAKVERSTDQAQADMKAQADKLGNKIENAADKAAVSMEDAAITAKIKAELAKDPSLSALKINVDTKQGLVMLSGTAPDANSRDRATRLAAAVKGVLSVDNMLVVNG